MRSFLITFFVFISFYSNACECKDFIPISKELCKDYDVVFDGVVDSVSVCDERGFSIAYFTITELYKGKVKKQVQINFDCNTECLMSFAEGEEWLIYSLYEKFDHLTISICGHSRKKFEDETLDMYTLNAKRTFAKEKEFLKITFGCQNFNEENEFDNHQDKIGSRNELPSNWGKLSLLLVSLLVMGTVYYFRSIFSNRNAMPWV